MGRSRRWVRPPTQPIVRASGRCDGTGTLSGLGAGWLSRPSGRVLLLRVVVLLPPLPLGVVGLSPALDPGVVAFLLAPSASLFPFPSALSLRLVERPAALLPGALVLAGRSFAAISARAPR